MTTANPGLHAAVAEDPVLGLSALKLAQKIHVHGLTSVEVTQAFLNRIAAIDEDIHTFLHVDAEEALAAAHKVDESPGADEEPAFALAGVPLALKGVFTTTDTPTTCASKMLEGYISPYDATATTRLRVAGIPILDKTNIDEFAMGSSTEDSVYSPTHNPWDVEHTAGSSGGGSSAALTSGMAPLAIGTDTGGSIRRPAALTATVGVKPACGTVPRYDLVACASSLDQGGPTARTVLDAALLHEVVASRGENSSTSTEQPIADVIAATKGGAAGDLTEAKVGIVKQFNRTGGYQAGVLNSFHEAVNKLREASTEVVEVGYPNFSRALSAYYLVLPYEISSNLAHFDGMRYSQHIGDDGTYSADEVMVMTRAAGFGDEVKRHIITSTYTLSVGYYDTYYVQIQRVRTLIQQDFERAFEKVDVLILPATPITAFKLGEEVDDPLSMHMFDLYTLPLNLAGMCGMSMPSDLAEDTDLPVGLQIMVPRHGDDRLYKVGVAYEKVRGPIA